MTSKPTTVDPSGILERTKTYHDIKWRLRQQLGTQWGPGVRLPPIKALARKLRTGQTNTHRAVKELVREGLLVSRPGQGTFVTPNVETDPLWSPPTSDVRMPGAHAAALEGKWIEVLTATQEPDAFIRKAVDAFRNQMARHGCRVTRAVSSHNADAVREHSQADAVLIVNPEFKIELTAGRKQALSVISTGHDLKLLEPVGYDLVGADSQQGGLLAAQRLRAAGCKSAMFIGCQAVTGDKSNWDITSLLRLRGFELGWGQTLPADHSLRLEHYMSTAGARAVTTYLQFDPRPDAVFAASDELAIGFIHGALAHGLTPGKDFQIIGFDGQQRGRDLPTGELTSVEVPMHRIGELAATLLVQRMLDPNRPVHRVLLGCTMYEGSTVRH